MVVTSLPVSTRAIAFCPFRVIFVVGHCPVSAVVPVSPVASLQATGTVSFPQSVVAGRSVGPVGVYTRMKGHLSDLLCRGKSRQPDDLTCALCPSDAGNTVV